MHPEMEEYLDILRGQDKAEGTLQQYSGGLNAFSDWLDEEDLDYWEVTMRDLQRYLAWLKNERGYAPKTIRGYFSPVSGFYKDQEAAGIIDEDPTDDIVVADYASQTTRKEEVTKEKRVWLPKEDVENLVTNVPAPRIRNRLIVLFMYFTGLRRQEVADVKIEDLDREERMVRVRGKGDKLHTAHWQPRLDGLLIQWLDQGYRDASPYATESPYLFVSESGPHVSADRINKIVREAAENAGLQEVLFVDAKGRNRYKITSHVLRHSFAMHWLQNGGSIEGLSKNMAHSTITTTEIYGEILEERAKDEYEQFAPDISIEI